MRKKRIVQVELDEDEDEKSVEALAKQEVDKFFGQSINWMSELKEYCVGDHDDVKWSRVSIGDTLYVAQHFDLLKWWEKKGQHLFKLIRLVAPRILATPGSNAFQERIFSKCTFFDSKLRAKTGDNRFEMGVLSAANRGEMKAVAPLSQDLLGTASDSVSSFLELVISLWRARNAKTEWRRWKK